VLELSAITFSYHGSAITFSYHGSSWKLDGIDLTVAAGEVVGIIGPNGSGKSTLLRIAGGMLTPFTGTVLLRGKELLALPRKIIALTVGYLPQKVVAGFDYTVEEIVALGRFPHLRGIGFLSDTDRRIVRQSLELTGLESLRRRSIRHISGGEQQRVFLASVLAQQPELLLLDEPTTGLDVHHQTTFFSLLRKLAGRGLGVLVVTHELNLASLYCDRLYLLTEGKMVSQGTVNEVFKQAIIDLVWGESVLVHPHPLVDRPILIPRLAITKSKDDGADGGQRVESNSCSDDNEAGGGRDESV
jgi:iron complex transport system ATP-binding protein